MSLDTGLLLASGVHGVPAEAIVLNPHLFTDPKNTSIVLLLATPS